MSIIFYLHLVGATVWVGGLIVLGALVPTVRRVTDDRAVIQAMARRFAAISWTALGLLVVTGLVMAIDRFPWSTVLNWKIGLVLFSAMLAAWHTLKASDQSPVLRGAIQATILALALAILWLASII